MDREATSILRVDLGRRKDSDLIVNLDTVVLSSTLDERPIEAVTIISGENCGLRLDDVIEEAHEQGFLVWLVEDCEQANVILGLRSIFEVSNVFADDFSVGDEEALTVNDVRDHHDLIKLDIWELQRLLGTLNIKRHDSEVSFVEFIFQMRQSSTVRPIDRVLIPEAAADLIVDLDTSMVRNIILTDVNDLRDDRVGVWPIVSCLTLVIPAFVGVLSLALCLVFLDDRNQVISDLQELLHVAEAQLDVLLLLA